MSPVRQPHYRWWQTGTIYQIYPRSFMDADGDGTGDLAGILERLDYLQWVGFDAIWLSPVFPSPMADFGYDVANYTDIDPLFGTLDDFDRLLAAVHTRGMRLLLDLVPNHTSSRHPWFTASRAGRDNPKRDWYLWRDPGPGGGPPNNWTSYFGGDAWTLDPATGQYYLHLFDHAQPDLNWRNPQVRTAIYDVMRFWLDRGVDGFRVDAMPQMAKDAQWRDDPPNPDWRPGDLPETRQDRIHSAGGPEIHQIGREMRAVVDAYDDRVLIGEIYLPVLRLIKYYGAKLDEVHLPFNFQLITLPWKAAAIRKAVEAYEAALPPGAWPNWVLGNHDNPRIASRTSPAQARVAQMLLLTLRGTPTCYYGDELGMRDGTIPPESARDPRALLSPGFGRDPERTPMQWDGGVHAGFSTATPWLPPAEDYRSINVEVERSDPRSTLTLVRRLLTLRRSSLALTVGSYRAVPAVDDDLVVYVREVEGERLLMALNLGSRPSTLNVGAVGAHGEL
ncbi:MAG: alpha-amylase family glycosyl hydrolase, partial [Chloroflexota bacterium]